MGAIWFMFQVLIAALCIGAIIAFVYYIPLAIYIIPYTLWVGNENTKGKQLDKKKESNWKSAKNATKLYISWIRRKKPSF
ncbi:hypothetical protein V3851_07500 [Paenibacillus sp. M1]|uniref:Uncharacterized protein n=1 Tax=Paenibacillus haidiansis TaxID=1574488 RepID=A0ABU7VR40_9BACL